MATAQAFVPHSRVGRSGELLCPILAATLAFVVLMLGQVTPDPRLTLSGLPLNTLFMLGCAGFAMSLPLDRTVRRDFFLGLMLVMLLGVTLLWSREPESGAEKLVNTVLSAGVAGVLMLVAIQAMGLQLVLRIWLAMLILLLLGAVIYKLQFGFLDRDVRYLVNGPIVFARFMGFGALIGGYLLVGWRRLIVVVAFLLAVVWTESKGPLLALLAVGFWFSYRSAGRRGRFGTLVLAGVLLAILIARPEILAGMAILGRLLIALTVFDVGVSDATYGSIGSRVELLLQSLQLIQTHPLGVGVGAWASRTGLLWAEYPHNLFMEVLSEGGLILGSMALLAYVLYLWGHEAVLRASCWFLLLCQQVSGDLLDSRLLLALSLVAFASRCNSSTEVVPARLAGASA